MAECADWASLYLNEDSINTLSSDDDSGWQRDPSGQALLRKQLRDVLDSETLCFLSKYVDLENSRRASSDGQMPPEHYWAIFRLVKQSPSTCDKSSPIIRSDIGLSFH